MIFKFIKYMLQQKKFEPNIPGSYDAWYNADEKLWTAQFKNENGDQIGDAGFGPSKNSAIDDLHYQNVDLFE